MVSTNKTILCIEDDSETAALIAEDLEERGYAVTIAVDGQYLIVPWKFISDTIHEPSELTDSTKATWP